MIFERLTLHNFGAYQGEHSIDLSVAPGKPVILVGALNGSGKTTLLEATQLALFGRAVRGTSRARMSYPDYLRQLINRGVRPEMGAAVGLTFRHRNAGRDDLFTITRTWRKAGAGIKEELEVLRNEVLDTEATARWLEFVEEFLPVQLADLFLFDGERIEALADPERSTEFLKSGIHALLGLDLVDHLSRTLLVHERGKRTAGTANRVPREALEKAESNLTALRTRSADLYQQKGSAEGAIGQARKATDRARQSLVKQGGDLLADRDKIEAQADQARKQLEARAASLRKIAEGEAPLLRVTELLAEARTVVEQVAEGQVASTIRDVLVQRDQELGMLLAASKVSKAAQTKIEQFLEASRAQWSHRTSVLPDLGINAAGFDSLAGELCPQLRSEIAGQLKAFEQERSKMAADIARKDAVPSKESLKTALEGVQAAEDELARTVALAEVLSVEYTRLAGQIERAEAEVERCQGAVRELSLADEVDTRIIRHSLKARDTLTRFRLAVAARNVERLENLISERLQIIMRKRDSLVDCVRIDPDSFELELRDKEGRSLDPLLLSAGERQLLAVAIVWALAKASGRTLPTIIDTPLGRLDGEHRAKLVETYFPEASHQVILLSTDEEINGRYYEQLRPKVAREYLISFDPKTRSSCIESGYFIQNDRAVA